MSNTLTTVQLLAVPIGNDYKHTFFFESVEAQTNYFLGRKVHSLNECAYQRKDRVIKYDACIDDIIKCNYVMYRNNAHSTKWYYAFITKMEYKNDNLTEITIETDVIQTWFFDYLVKTSFIEREHVNDDTVGKHTIPEGLDTGEYICNQKMTNTDLQDVSLVMGCTLDINSYTNQPDDWNATKEFKPDYGANYNGLFSGLKYFIITPSQLKTVMKYIAYEGQEEAVHSLFYAPTAFLDVGQAGTHATDVNPSDNYKMKTWLIGEKPNTINGYPPRNKKLLTAPYQYLLIDNGGGGAVEYLYEKFDTDSISFNVYSVLTAGMSIKAIPLNYNGAILNESEGINLSKYSTCSWTSDAYTSWLTQSAVNVGLSTAGAVASTVGALALAPATAGGSLVVGAGIAGGVLAVGSSLATANERLSTPPQLHGNVNNGDVATALGDVTFRAYKMSIRKEYAEAIDGYFTMYGYKVNRLGVPLTNHRKGYWYTKTIDANISGNLPQEDLQKIKQCYNNGITFWKNTANVCNFHIDNSIL